MPVGCNCSEILPIRACSPYANHGDVSRALNALSQCIVGDIGSGTDPVADPSTALAEAFPDGFNDNCEPDYLIVKRADGAHYMSTDLGVSWFNMGGTAGAASSVQADQVLNNSGVTLTPGSVVVWDFSADRAVEITTDDTNSILAGVWTDTTLHGAEGTLTNRGIAVVLVDSAVARGDALVISASNAGEASRKLAQGKVNVIGYALESLGSPGAVLAFVDCQYDLPRYATYSYVLAENTAGPTFTSGADRTVPLNTEESDLGGIGALASNQVTLQPGIYKVRGEVSVIGNGSGFSEIRMKIHNITAAADVLVGTNRRGGVNQPATPEVSGIFQITVASVMELRIRTTATTQALAALDITGESEKYATLHFERMDR